MAKTAVRASAVAKALATLAQQQEHLAKVNSLEVSVYLDWQLTPESFPAYIEQGAIILRFTRYHPANRWSLDTSQFDLLTHL